MRLVDQGRASLDDHPGKYVEEAKKLHPAITMRMLLNHTSGLPDFSQSEEYLKIRYTYPVDIRAMIDCIASLPMNAEPGTTVRYINAGFFLTSVVTESIAGLPWREYIEKEVFQPLGMEHSGIDQVPLILPDRAAGYDFSGMDIVQPPHLFADWMMGAGAGYATVDDVYQLHTAVRDRLLVSETAWKEILTPSGGAFGLGCSVSSWHGKLRYQHNGGFTGFRTLHVHLPEDDFDIILLSNMGFGNARTAFSEAIHALYYEGETAASDQPRMDAGYAHNSERMYPTLCPQHPPVCSLPLDEYIGTYTNRKSCMEIVSDGTDGLRAVLPSGQVIAMYPMARDLFANRLVDENYRFERSADGRIMFSGMIKD